MTAIDLNGDSKADVVGLFNSSMLVYISNGDGTFKSPVSYDMGVSNSNAISISLGDFNGDGKTDVAMSTAPGNVAGSEVVFLGNGDGTFDTTPKSSGGLYYPQSAVVYSNVFPGLYDHPRQTARGGRREQQNCHTLPRFAAHLRTKTDEGACLHFLMPHKRCSIRTLSKALQSDPPISGDCARCRKEFDHAEIEKLLG